jgi:SAM-dependent methyltransferase
MSVRTWESEEYHSFWRRSNRAYLDRMERRLLDRLLAPGRWFIDLGGGYGRLMDLYRDRCPNVVISDYSISMLEDANRRLVREGIRNVRLVAADVNRMPFRPGVFDSAMMIRLIHHLQDPEPALREVRRILAPKASFVFEYQNKHNLNFLIKAGLGLMKRRDLSSPAPLEVGRLYWNFHPRAMEGIVTAGFTVARRFGGGLFWNRKLLTSLVPRLEVVDSALAPLMGRWALTHQIFLKLEPKADAPAPEESVSPHDSTFDEILQCPACGNPRLDGGADRRTCARCRRSYPFRDNISDFRLDAG